MLSKDVVLFCQKETTDKKKHLFRCPERSLSDHQLLDNSFGQPHPIIFCRTFGQGRAVQKCCPFLLLTWNFLEISPPQMTHTPDTTIIHVEVAAISAAARRQLAWYLLDSTHHHQPGLSFDRGARCGCLVASNRVGRGVGCPR